MLRDGLTLGIAIGALALWGCKKGPATEPVTVAAAADLAFAFRDLGPLYEKATGQPVIFSFGSTGILAKQIAEGAPFDAFAAANASFADEAVSSGACLADSRTPYATGRIVVYRANGAAVAPKTLAELTDPRITKIAIANPEHAPYGHAAKEAMQHVGVWDAVSAKVVYGENVQQALQFAQSGNADVAIVALSRLIRPALRGLRALRRRARRHAQVRVPLAGSVEYFLARESYNTLTPLLLSLQIALLATTVAAVLGIAVAALLANVAFPGRDWVDVVVTAPIILPPTVLGYYVLVSIGRRSGIGHVIESVFGSPIVFTRTGAVVAASVGALPLVVKSGRAAIEAVDTTLVRAARSLGAGPFRAFVTVQLPLAGRGVLAAVMLAFARSLGDFGVTLMVAGDIPGQTQTASLALYDAIQEHQDRAALGLALSLTAIGVTVLYTVNKLASARDAR